MTGRDIASAVLECVGGVGNVVTNSLCMTRLRLTVANPSAVNRTQLDLIEGVLGVSRRGPNGIEVVFGPKMVHSIFEEFSKLTGIPADYDPLAGFRSHPSNLHVHISPSRHKSDAEQGEAKEERAQADTPAEETVEDDVLELTRLLEEGINSGGQRTSDDEDAVLAPAQSPIRRRLLVINGPNLNMLGIREPDVYGREDYPSLLELCKRTAQEAGFVNCRCFQSNHEGDIVDEIQDAFGVFDGIVINPGAYTHTSIALLDALKAVGIPAIEVHISKVEEREAFRQVSYVRDTCFKTITGMGIEGYAEAIRLMAEHLGM